MCAMHLITHSINPGQSCTLILYSSSCLAALIHCIKYTKPAYTNNNTTTAATAATVSEIIIFNGHERLKPCGSQLKLSFYVRERTSENICPHSHARVVTDRHGGLYHCEGKVT